MHSFIGRVPLREPKSVKEVDRKNSVKSDEKNRPSHSTFPGHQSGAFRLRLRARKSNSFVKHQLSHVVALFFRPTHPQWLCRCRKHTQTLAASAPSFFGYSLHQQIFSSGAPFVWPSIWLDAALFYTTNVYLVAPKLI